jgi:hypothetical protein
VPMPNRTMDTALLLDGYHLSASGATTFSTQAGAALHAVLDQPEPAATSTGAE